MEEVDYRILGTLEAVRSGKQVSLGGAKQRAVLAILLLRANRVVTTDELIEALWPESPPGKPHTAIQGYVSQLRRRLSPELPFGVIVTEAAGYRLPVGRDKLDLLRFEALLRRGKDALRGGRAEDASDALGEALELFRGPPLAEFTYESWAQSDIGRLVDLRLTCLEERIEADLRLGRHAEVVGELQALIVEHPLREGLRGHLMVALYRAGRQSEALAAYQEARTTLVEEFGIEPNRALQELERKILLQDSSLDLKRETRPAAPAAPAAQELTLLFTDIEGSTRLLHRLGDDYAHVLVEHRRLLSEAIEREGGRIVDNYGDSFFAAFGEPLQALAAATSAQRALGSYPWPDGVPLKVRMGVHIGEPVAVGNGYVGLVVHRAARICDAAHGGQILVSSEVAHRVGESAATTLQLRDLGEHRLKDLAQPQRLLQVVAAGLGDSFAPPRTQEGSTPPPSDRSILVVADGSAPLDPVVRLAAPLAGSVVPHELIVAELVDVGSESPVDPGAALIGATAHLEQMRGMLGQQGVDVRVAAFTSASVGADVVRLASEQAVDLILLGRSREDLGREGLDTELATVLADAPCDVAVCVPGARAGDSDLVLVPFGGGTHDWAALELGVWLASANGLRLRLLGVTGDPNVGQRDASRLLAAASLAAQHLANVPTEPVLLPAGGEALVHAADQGAAVVFGLPEHWRDRGLGQVRTHLLERSSSTTLFVRRGIRPGGLAPSEGQTRFTWSISEARVPG